MKKVLLLMAVVSFIGYSAKAQGVSFGLKAGMTASTMKASTSMEGFDFKSKIGFYAGAIAEIGVSENFAVQPEVYYEMLGAKMKVDYGEGSMEGQSDLGYVSIPLLAKYRNQGFSAFLGPQIGILISAKGKSDGETEDIKDQFNSTDFAGVVGVGYTLTNGFGFDARYQMGFSNIAKDSGDETLKNNAFTVGIHYLFNKQQ